MIDNYVWDIYLETLRQNFFSPWNSQRSGKQADRLLL